MKSIDGGGSITSTISFAIAKCGIAGFKVKNEGFRMVRSKGEGFDMSSGAGNVIRKYCSTEIHSILDLACKYIISSAAPEFWV
jgi:hypothetical protein